MFGKVAESYEVSQSLKSSLSEWDHSVMSLAAVCPIQECTLARGGQVTERTPKASGRKTATHMLQ